MKSKKEAYYKYKFLPEIFFTNIPYYITLYKQVWIRLLHYIYDVIWTNYLLILSSAILQFYGTQNPYNSDRSKYMVNDVRKCQALSDHNKSAGSEILMKWDSFEIVIF